MPESIFIVESAPRKDIVEAIARGMRHLLKEELFY